MQCLQTYKKPVLTSDSDCYDIKFNYTGNDLIQKSGLDSYAQCFVACLNYGGCKAFSYQLTGKICYLKSATAEKTADDGYVSGAYDRCATGTP